MGDARPQNQAGLSPVDLQNVHHLGGLFFARRRVCLRVDATGDRPAGRRFHCVGQLR
jgi:hypothetical protein